MHRVDVQLPGAGVMTVIGPPGPWALRMAREVKDVEHQEAVRHRWALPTRSFDADGDVGMDAARHHRSRSTGISVPLSRR